MQKNNKIICFLTVFLFIVFAALAFSAYPRIIWWMFKPVEGKVVALSADEVFSYPLFFSLTIAICALFIGVGTFIISKKRNLKETIVGWFVLIDVAVVAMIAWLAVLKYRFMKVVSIQETTQDGLSHLMLYQVSSIHLFEIAIAASAAVLLVAWIYPKKFED